MTTSVQLVNLDHAGTHILISDYVEYYCKSVNSRKSVKQIVYGKFMSKRLNECGCRT